MKIGIMGHGFVGWNGGVDFIRHIVMCLRASDSAADHRLVVLVPCDDPARPPSFTEGFRHDFGPDVEIALIASHGQALYAAIKAYGLDVLAPSLFPLAADFGVPWLGYMYDFQHKYLSHLFTDQERARRDTEFHTMVTTAEAAVVNSNSVAADAARFFPDGTAEVIALPFFAAPNPSWFADQRQDVAAQYGLAKPYFIVCNQFWVHKNHFTAFMAFAKIAADHPDIDLVCTGTTEDHRMPDYFKLLQDALVSLGIAPRVHILGHIPKADQVALLRGSLAVIQPTGFEGGPGGGAVYDAVSLGVPSFVSDIPVNRELTDPTVRFFAFGEDAALADLMAQFLREPPPVRASEAQLVAEGQVRRRLCGNILIDAIGRLVAKAAHEASAPARRTALSA